MPAVMPSESQLIIGKKLTEKVHTLKCVNVSWQQCPLRKKMYECCNAPAPVTNSIQLFLHGEANPPPPMSLFLSNSLTGKRGKLLAVLAEQKNCSSI